MDAMPMTEEDKMWRAQDDARALIRAKVVEADAERLKAAREAAKAMLAAEMAEQDAMRAVAEES